MSTLNISQKGMEELVELMDTPLFNAVRRTDEVKHWRNEIHADWISNFMHRMQQEMVPEANLVDDKTGKAHTVESMVLDLRDRVKLDSLEKSAEYDTEVDGEPLDTIVELDTEEELKTLFDKTELDDDTSVDCPESADNSLSKLKDFLDQNPDVKNALKAVLGDPIDQVDHTPLEEESEELLLSASMILSANSKKKDLELKNEIEQFIEDLFASHRGGVDDMAVVWALREKYGANNLLNYGNFIEEKIKAARERNPSGDMKFILPTPYMGTPMRADPQGNERQPMFENIKNM